jgi:hypothetical protein
VQGGSVVLDGPGWLGGSHGGGDVGFDSGQLGFLLFDGGAGGIDGVVGVLHQLVEAVDPGAGGAPLLAELCNGVLEAVVGAVDCGKLFGVEIEPAWRELFGDPFVEKGSNGTFGDGDLEGMVDLAGVEVA